MPDIDTYAVDDDIISLTRTTRKPCLKVYRPEKNMIVVGRGTKADIELRTDECKKDGIDVLKRHGGGCAVVLDPGNVVVSLTYPVNGIGNNNSYFKIISEWIIKALKRIGIDGIYHDGISDLVEAERKIAGACIYRTKDTLYYSTSILVRPSVELMEKYLKHPPREPEYRKGRSHSDFVKAIGSECKPEDIERSLKNELDLNELEESLKNMGG